MARENEVVLLGTKFYNLHIISVEKFCKKLVCYKIEGVQKRFVQIQHLKTIQHLLVKSHSSLACSLVNLVS